MKKFVYSIAGALFFGIICISITWAIGAIFGPLSQGEETSARNFKLFLLAFLASIVTGAISGFIYAKG